MLKLFIKTILILALSTPAAANVTSVGNQNFNTVPDGLDFLTVHSSETLKPGIFNFGFFFNNAVNSLPYFEGSTQDRTSFNDSLLGLDLNMGVGLAKDFEVGLSLPFILAQTVKSDSFHGQFVGNGNTEVRLLAKYRLYGDDRGGLATVVSTNINRTGDNPYVGNKAGPIYNLELAWDTTINDTAWGVNLGYRKTNPGEAIPGSPIEPIGDQVIASTALSHLLPKYDVKVIGEVFGGWPAQKKSSNPDRVNSSLEMILGLKYDISHNLSVQGGGGTELQHGVSSPDWRVYGGLNYVIGPVFSQSQSHVEATDQNQRFRLSHLNFEFDSERMSEASEKALAEMAETIRKIGNFRQLVIEGHTDSIGSEDYNQVLSLKRAEAVKKYLVQQGFAAEKILAIGFGETKPIADNGNFQGREQNRRVEFEVVK